MRGLRLGLGLGRNGGGGGITVSIGSGLVITGTELTATVNGLVGGETVTYQWTDDGANITGATASTYTVAIGTDSVADASAIRVVVTVDGTPYTSNARTVAYAAGAFGALSPQLFTDNSANQTYVFSAATGANLTWTYSLVSPPSGVTIVSATRTITFDTDALAAQTDTAFTVRATDQYGRTIDQSSTFTVSSAILYNFVDNLDQDPPAVSLDSLAEGTLYIDFDTSATPPTYNTGDIGTLTESITIGTFSGTLDLSAFSDQTGYLHFTLLYDTVKVSNTLTSQQITVPGNAILDRFGSTILDRAASPINARAA